MAREYVEKLEALLGPVSGKLPPEIEIGIKHFFSGAAAYANGRICITLTPVGLAMKLAKGDGARLTEEYGAKPLRYFPKAPVKKDYALLPESFGDDAAKLAHWARRSIDHVLARPRPKRRKPRS